MNSRLIKILLAAFLLCFATVMYGQRQAYHWHFGEMVSIDFSSGTPVLAPPSSMTTQEGCAVQSDTDGNLLFYTNGGGRPASSGSNTGMIWNRNHEIMYDMRGLEGGGFSARQSAISFPVPGSDHRYYLFTMEENEFSLGGNPADQPAGRGMSYFIIDMELNNGLGGVEIADQRVHTPMYEGLTAVAMSDQAGYWLIGHKDEISLVVVPVTADSVGEAQTYIIEGQGDLDGAIKSSPNGEILYCNRRVIKFDPANGTPVAEESTLLIDASGLTAEFTANSRYLYTTADGGIGRRLIRYDLQANDIIGSAAPLFLFPSTGFTYQMQLASNGNIYFLEEENEDNQKGLSEISCPASNQPELTRFMINLPDQLFLLGLPNFPPNIFEPLATTGDTIRIVNDSLLICAGTEVSLSTITSGTSYSWSDGSSDNLLFTSIPGDYSVTITGNCDPVVEQFHLSNIPELAIDIQLLSDTSILCVGQDSIILAFQSNMDVDDTAIWTIIGPDEELFVIDTLAIPVMRGDKSIVLRLSNECQTVYDTFRYSSTDFSAMLEVDHANPLCPEDEVTLSIQGTNVEAVLWEDNSMDFSRIIADADSNVIYFADVFSRCEDSIRLFADLDYSECPVVCDAAIPDLISPNNDRTNDIFKVFTNCELEDFNMKIFNRWGQIVHQTSSQDDGWDGTVKGEAQPMDTYLYLITYRFPDNPTVFKKDGQFVLVR